MTSDAWYVNGYELHHGKLELVPYGLCFLVPRHVHAREPLLELLMPQYDTLLAVPRGDLQGVYPSPHDAFEMAVYTRRGMLIFTVTHRPTWIQVLGLYEASAS